MTPAVKAGYLAPYDSFANRVAILRFVQDIPTRPSHPTYRLVAEIGRGLALFTGHPMLIIWGAQDWCFTTDFLKEWQTRFPNAEVHLVPDAGHYVVEDAHERIIPWVREFLAKHPISPHPPFSPEAVARVHKGPSPLEGEG